jgi:predicted ATPase
MALGRDLHLILEIVPALRELFDQRDFSDIRVEGSSSEAADRVLNVVRAFFAFVALDERPLVMFIDDLHWSSAAEITLISGLISSFREQGLIAALRNCLLIVSYRTNEFPPSNSKKLAEARKRSNISDGSNSPTDIEVGPLRLVSFPSKALITKMDLEELLLDALGLQRDEVSGTGLLHERFSGLGRQVMLHTGGNPFYVETVYGFLHNAHISVSRSLGLAQSHLFRLRKVVLGVG